MGVRMVPQHFLNALPTPVLVLQTSSAEILGTQAVYVVSHWNAKCAETLGYSSLEILGQDFRVLLEAWELVACPQLPSNSDDYKTLQDVLVALSTRGLASAGVEHDVTVERFLRRQVG
jgi:hypothetical protein